MHRRSIVSLALLGALLAPLPARALGVGDTAADFTVTDFRGGDPIHLSDYRGKVVVLLFFWTG